MEKKELFKKIIKSQKGVLYITGKPGIGKSAVMAQIAKEEGWQYIDIRLSQRDSSEILGFPYQEKVNGVSVMQYAKPKCFVDANSKPTLICFDELNRASLAVRNAALQILCERQLDDMVFNKEVYMVALGNLGDEDGTEVEELDSALNNRMIHFKYEMTIPEWISGYAKEHVNPMIISFVENNPTHFYRREEDEAAYATPRSWSNLSAFIGKDNNCGDQMEYLKAVAFSYVGSSAMRFIKYVEDSMVINLNMIMNGKFTAEQLKIVNRDKKSELMNELKTIDINKVKKDDLTNLVMFLENIDSDERVAFLHQKIKDITNEDIENKSNLAKLLAKFKDEVNSDVATRIRD